MEPAVGLPASLMSSHCTCYAGSILNSLLREAKCPQWVLNPQVPGRLGRLQQRVPHSLAVRAAFVQRGTGFLLLFLLASLRCAASPRRLSPSLHNSRRSPTPPPLSPGLSKPHPRPTPQSFPRLLKRPLSYMLVAPCLFLALQEAE